MSIYQVEQPLLGDPFSEPKEHWNILQDDPERLLGRRRALYYYREPKWVPLEYGRREAGIGIGMIRVNGIRQRLSEWRRAGYPGVTDTTRALLDWWRQPERRLFFAQLEAAETIIFLTEAPADFSAGLRILPDEPSEEKKALGEVSDGRGFLRYACKMATGTGKTTVMEMLAAWSILNKVNQPSDDRFSEVVLIVCPNLTICDRLRPLLTVAAEDSLYVTRNLLPSHLMPQLAQGRVITTTWHVFESAPPRPLALSQNGGGILVMNAEAHYAVRMTGEEVDDSEAFNFASEEDLAAFLRRANVWMDGLDDMHARRGIKLCLDFSATPYFLAGSATNRPFPWIVSEFGLADAIECGLLKVPQLAERGPSVSPLFPYQLPWSVYDEELIKQDISHWPEAIIPGNPQLWKWLLPLPRSVDYRADGPKPESILRYAYISLTMCGRLWEEERKKRAQVGDTRPALFLIACHTIKLAKVVYKWLAENKPPFGVPHSQCRWFLNHDDQLNTILLTNKVDQELEPPGAEVRCVVSAGLLPAGTLSHVTHVIGLRPFTSQLQCELVLGDALRRNNCEFDETQASQEILKVCGIPFEVVPFKANPEEGHPRWSRLHHWPQRPRRR